MSPSLIHLCIPSGRWVTGQEVLNSSPGFPKSSWSCCSVVLVSPFYHPSNREDNFLTYLTGEVPTINESESSTLKSIKYYANKCQVLLPRQTIFCATAYQLVSSSWFISLPHTGGEILRSQQGIRKVAWFRGTHSGLRNRRHWSGTCLCF